MPGGRSNTPQGGQGHTNHRNRLGELLDLYLDHLPSLKEEGGAQPDLSSMLSNASRWQAIFAEIAQDTSCELQLNLMSALEEEERVRVSLTQLKALWQKHGPAGDVRAALTGAAGGAVAGQGQVPLERRLAETPDVFLAEVSAGLHSAALVAAQQRPVASPQASHLGTPIAAGVAGTPASSSSRNMNNRDETTPQRIHIEIEAPELELPLQALRSECIGRYVGLRGSIVRCSNIAPLVHEFNFTCSRCNTSITENAPEGRFKYPARCPRKCRFARFNLNKELCKGMDWQRLRLQEDFAELSATDGPPRRVPKTVECDLRRRLVGCCVPGDAVALYGIVRHMPSGAGLGQGGEGRDAKQGSLFMLYLDVKAVLNNRRGEHRGDSDSSGQGGQDFTPLQLSFIRDVYQQQERLPLLVASFCPQIYGQRLVKAALLLALFGGLPIVDDSMEKRLRRRGDVHVVLLGDPGLGKSELLRALARLSPRGVYVAGNSSTVAGLTAAVVREQGGDFALEAGALILADNGLCCIDEFDKMGADQQALLEAMEQQTVSIAKAGIVCQLPARASVVTAANPAKGRWDMSSTFAQNLKGVMSEALLSRFDVAFLMRDEESAHEDTAISRHIVKRRMLGMAPSSEDGALFDAGPGQDWANSGSAEQAAGSRRDGTLGERCGAFRCKEGGLPRELLMTYVRYARCFSEPQLSEGAQRKLKEYYLKRRAATEGMPAGHIPVTPRLLESLVRLSQARARAELRRVVLCRDVDDVLDIMRAGAEDLEEKFALVPHRKGKNRVNQLVDRLRDRLDLLVRRTGRREVRESELKSYAGTGVTDVEFEKALFQLNSQLNVLLLTGGGIYRYIGGL